MNEADDITANDLVEPLTYGEAARMRMVSGTDVALLSHLRQPATQEAIQQALYALEDREEWDSWNILRPLLLTAEEP